MRLRITRHPILQVLLQACVALLFCFATTLALPAQTFSTLLSFNGTNGEQPYGALVQYTDGSLYGTTFSGGDTINCSPPYGCGSIFKITMSGALTTLHNFEGKDGVQPQAGLVLASDGNFYGTTSLAGGVNGGGIGTIFRMTPSGTLTTIYNFCSLDTCSGNASPSGLIQAAHGNLYGTTSNLGTSNLNCSSDGCGTIFSISPTTGTYQTIYNFCSLSNCADGFSPVGGVIQGADGKLYGVTSSGGGNTACSFIPLTGCGTVFSFNLTTGALTTLHVFAFTDGASPIGGLVQAKDDNLYGTTRFGGDSNCSSPQACGALFGITTGGAIVMDHAFLVSEPNTPQSGVIQGNDGDLYGTTTAGGTNPACSSGGCGALFKSTLSGTVTSLYSFGGGTDGSHPAAPLMQASNGNYYGTNIYHGNDSCNLPIGCGTVFSLTGSPALTVSLAGTGSGSVTSSPAGITCPSTCSAAFSNGTVVTLTATAAAGSTFAGWSGACSGTGTCAVTISAAKAVTATFKVTTYTLSVTEAGTGSGTVKSSPSGITCPSTCSANFNSGTVVTLTATTAEGSTFASWSGACTGTGICSVTMSAAKAVTATFNSSSSPAVTLTPTSLNFGTVATSVTSPVKTVTLKNSGEAALTITLIAVTGTNSGDFPETSNCASSLAAGASCLIKVQFKPSATGARSAAVSITDNAAGSPQQVLLSGTGTTAKLSPTPLSVGTLAVGLTSAVKKVTLINVGTTALTISSIAVTGAEAADFPETATTCTSSLAAAASCTVSLTFKPSTTGARSANLTVTDNAAGSPQQVPLSGIGTTAELTPTSLSFGSVKVGTTSAAKTVTLKNVGTTAITITSIRISGTDPGDYGETETCGSSLAASASCTISVSFKPTTTGTRSATLKVTDNAAGSPQQVSLSGTGS
jgi:uncharacterized repeat protein (TIGR03803 family)